MPKRLIRLASILLALAVALGAFGAHGLKDIVSTERLSIYRTGIDYHFIHGLGLLLLGLLSFHKRHPLLRWSAICFTFGIVAFSGSLYLLTFADTVALPMGFIGPITPLGGLAFIAGWILLFLATYKIAK